MAWLVLHAGSDDAAGSGAAQSAGPANSRGGGGEPGGAGGLAAIESPTHTQHCHKGGRVLAEGGELALRMVCAQEMPQQQVPAQMVAVARLPLTDAGKVHYIQTYTHAYI